MEIRHDLSDPSRFERAYRDHHAQAVTAALGVLRDLGAAEDVAQEVFAHLWRNPRAFNPARGSLSSYVRLMARSRALDHWRARAARDAARERLSQDELGSGPPVAESAADVAGRRQEARRAFSALARLPADQREAVLLAYGGGLPARDVATFQGVPVGTAKSRIRLGRRRAKLTLEAA